MRGTSGQVSCTLGLNPDDNPDFPNFARFLLRREVSPRGSLPPRHLTFHKDGVVIIAAMLGKDSTLRNFMRTIPCSQYQDPWNSRVSLRSLTLLTSIAVWTTSREGGEGKLKI